MELNSKDFIGEATAVLSEIVHRPSATELRIVNGKSTNSTMLIKCEELEQSNKVVRGCLEGVDLPRNCFFLLSHILFVHSLGCLSIHLIVYSLGCSSNHSLDCSFVHWIVHLFIGLFICSLDCSFDS